MIYFVSNNGNDLEDGKTPETAWKTIQKVNASVESGDEIRFRCGDIFYGTVIAKCGISFEQRTLYTSYGEGNRPLISNYSVATANAWEVFAENIYKIDMNNTQNYTGNIFNANANAGFIKVSGRIFYNRCAKIDLLKSQWDFCCDCKNGFIYVYSEKNPAELSDDIRIACSSSGVGIDANVALVGLEICGTGGHGIGGITQGAYIADCYVHEIGGSELLNYSVPNVRFGNCIELWAGSADVTVEHCKFADVYDVAITMQGNNPNRDWANMYFVNNEFWDCTQCLEIWSDGDDKSIGFVNCKFENNVCINTGDSWGYQARPNKLSSVPLLIYQLHTDKCDISVRNNIFAGLKVALIFKLGGASAMPKGYVIENNTIIRSPEKPLLLKLDDENEEAYNKFSKFIEDKNLIINRIQY